MGSSGPDEAKEEEQATCAAMVKEDNNSLAHDHGKDNGQGRV